MKLEAFLSSLSASGLMRPDETAYGSKTSHDWLKRSPSVLRCAMIGPLSSARTTETFVRQMSCPNALWTIPVGFNLENIRKKDIKTCIWKRFVCFFKCLYTWNVNQVVSACSMYINVIHIKCKNAMVHNKTLLQTNKRILKKH